MVVRLFLLTVAATLLGGCGGKDDEAPASSTEATTTTAAPNPALEGASTEPLVWTSAVTKTALLTHVRTGRRQGYDRIVFEFDKGTPGYDVRYVQPPVHADGSGEAVAIGGGAVLLVRMEPALDADLSQESAPRTYTGPTRLSPDTEAVVELVRIGGFEAVLTWAIGVDEARPFRVIRLEKPARIVIDVGTG